MRWSLFIPILAIILRTFGSIHADEGGIFLEKLIIKGNRVTKESFIRQRVTLTEGKPYNTETLIDEINRTRENLQKTALFSSIFFDDQIDENNRLILTLQLKEENYLFFGPSGYTGYEKEQLYSKNSLYLAYTNLFGNSSHLAVEAHLYEDIGFTLQFRGRADKRWYLLNTEFKKPLEDTGRSSLKLSPGASFLISENFSIGTNVLISSYNSIYSLGVFPFIEVGYNQRLSAKIKRWHYFVVSPYAGYNSSNTYYYGIESRLNMYRDLLLKIVYTLKLQGRIQGGEVPDNIIYKTIVRGTSFDDYIGTKQFSVTNEIHVPLPWRPSIGLVAFLDADLIGSTKPQFFIGGGIGLHWVAKYQNPLIIEIAFGKGFMLNYQRKFY